jgi:glyoxylase I family protein
MALPASAFAAAENSWSAVMGWGLPSHELGDSMALTATGYHHVRLTVTDIARSRAFYDSVFGFDIAYEVPEGANEATKEQLGFLFGGVIYSFGEGSLLGLRPVADDTFSPDRTGLDHVSIVVTHMAAAAAHLDELGIAHDGIKDLGAISILEFKDPDGISLELTAVNG